MVLCAASCPSLPHGASFAVVGPLAGAHVDSDDAVTEEPGEGTEIDLESDGDEEEAFGDVNSKIAGRDGLFSVNAGRGFEPLSLKQLCEAKLAQEVDLHNAGAVLAYAVRRLYANNDAKSKLLLWHSNQASKGSKQGQRLLAVQSFNR